MEDSVKSNEQSKDETILQIQIERKMNHLKSQVERVCLLKLSQFMRNMQPVQILWNIFALPNSLFGMSPLLRILLLEKASLK